MSITVQQLLLILPNAGPVAGVYVPVLNTAMNRYQVVGAKRVAAFIAQIGHESGQLKYIKEIWGGNRCPGPLRRPCGSGQHAAGRRLQISRPWPDPDHRAGQLQSVR